MSPGALGVQKRASVPWGKMFDLSVGNKIQALCKKEQYALITTEPSLRP